MNMGAALADKRIAILGGDARSFFYAPLLKLTGAGVRAVGFEKTPALMPCELLGLAEALLWANVVILPMAGVDSEGHIAAPYGENSLRLTREMCLLTPSGLLVLTGIANAHLKELSTTYGWTLVEVADRDEFALLNSIPSAEGALQMAMEASDITIHGSVSLVLGFGRTGGTIAKDLAGLGAEVTVAARRPHDLARAQVFGYGSISFFALETVIQKADFIFNTAPALVLPRSLLAQTKKEVVIVDIASGPGGVDYAAARRLGRKALLAPSLPGKVAPRTAGTILGELLPGIIEQYSIGRGY